MRIYLSSCLKFAVVITEAQRIMDNTKIPSETGEHRCDHICLFFLES
jgi:hypothetical protein